MKTDQKRRKSLKYLASIGLLPFACNIMSAANLGKKVTKFRNELVLDGDVITAAHWGTLKIGLKNGEIISSGKGLGVNNIYNDLQSNIKGIIHQSRVLYPMVRKSYLKDPLNPRPELRGRDEWVRVSYDYAIKLAADAIKRTIKKHGNEGIYAGSYGWQSSGRLHAARTLLARFFSNIGGSVTHVGDYSAAASQVIMPHVVGSIEVYEQQTSWPLLLQNAKVVLLWGLNPYTTLKIAWSSTDGMGLMYFEQLKKLYHEGKIRLIYIDPVYSESAKALGIKKEDFINIRSNTDTALMLGMAYHLYTTNNYNKEFMDTYTTGFERFLPYLLGKSDGVPKTPAWASKITNLDEHTIKYLAMQVYKNPSMIMSGWGIQRQDHGEQPHWMLVTLACMLGQIGKPGTGFGLCYHYSNGGNPTCVAPVLGGLSTICEKNPNPKLCKIKIPVARFSECVLKPGKKIQFNGREITYPNISLVYWVGGNPVVHQQNVNNNLRAFRTVDTVIVNEIYFTPTARMSDILFPVKSQYERNDLTMNGDYSNEFISPIKQCISPLGESRSDYEIFCALSKELGVYDYYSDGGKDEFDWLKIFYDKALKQSDSLQLSLPSFEEFWLANKPLRFYPSKEAREFVRFKDFIQDPILSPLGTPSGLIEIYSEVIEKMHYADCAPHPRWFEPIEWLGMQNKPARFALVSSHPYSRLHSQQNNNLALRDTYAINGREPVWINDLDAKELGISHGDLVRVFNARGQILAGAFPTPDIARDTLRVCEGAWYDPIDKSDNPLCLNGCANVLTIDKPSSSLAMANIAHTALVNIEKFTGNAPAVRVFDRIKASRI